MIINVVLFLMIIALNIYTGVLSYSFYSTKKVNHFAFRHIYNISCMILLQSAFAIYEIISGDTTFSKFRWLCFSLSEISMLYFVLRPYVNRHFELIITVIFTTIVLLSTLWFSIWFNVAIVVILISLSLLSKDEILVKWFSWSFVLYGMTSVVPSVFGFTQFESILAGFIFTLHFTIGVRKLYMHDKTDDELKKLLLENKL